jgi:hypothetical protein
MNLRSKPFPLRFRGGSAQELGFAGIPEKAAEAT